MTETLNLKEIERAINVRLPHQDEVRALLRALRETRTVARALLNYPLSESAREDASEVLKGVSDD